MDTITTALMSTEEFAKTANMASNMQLRMKQGMNSHMAKQLAWFNMPSREDVTALAERVMTMDDRLVRIEEMLRQMVPVSEAASAGGPPRTKTPRTKTSGTKTPSTKTGGNRKPAAKKAASAKKTTKKATAKKATVSKAKDA